MAKIARNSFSKRPAPPAPKVSPRNFGALAGRSVGATAVRTQSPARALGSAAGRSVGNAAARVASRRSSGGGGGGNYGGAAVGGFGGAIGGGATAASMAPMSIATPEPPRPKTWDQLSEQERTDYLKGDATYTAQQASLEQELQNLIAELAMQRTNYNTDYTSALSNMGWSEDLKGFDPNNLLGAYGMSFQNQQNDFAGRGMLDSSAYSNALTNLGTSFDKQKGDLETARGNFLRELETRETGARNTRDQDLQRARADAIARRAAREGIV